MEVSLSESEASIFSIYSPHKKSTAANTHITKNCTYQFFL